MKIRYLISLAALCLTVAACSDDDEPKAVLSETEFQEISYEGTECIIQLTTQADWTATTDARWCKMPKSEGVGNGQLIVNVEANLGEARSAEITLTADGERHTIALTQQAKPAGTELVYRLPVVFHIIHFDPSDPVQNPPAEVFNKMVEQCNALYRHSPHGGVDMQMELVMATRDPNGNLMEEPGIDRIQWVSSTMDARDVMDNRTRKYVHFMWEPSEYINILVYQFTDNTILGISTFPLALKSDPLAGLDAVEDYDYRIENLCSVRGLSLNATYIADPSDYLSPIAPQPWKKWVDMQNEGYITLAHELGHFLGLYHSFSEYWFCMDTDHCKDTESYDRTNYNNILMAMYDELDADPTYAEQMDWSELFMRQNCSNKPFESHNLMDYQYSYLDEFTPEQRERVRHVLSHSPYMPGPKVKSEVATRAISGPVELPLTLMDAEPREWMRRK